MAGAGTVPVGCDKASFRVGVVGESVEFEGALGCDDGFVWVERVFALPCFDCGYSCEPCGVGVLIHDGWCAGEFIDA